MDTNFADWNNADATNHDFPFDFTTLNLKSSPFVTAEAPFTTEDTAEPPATNDDPFAGASNGFSSIIGNNNLGNQLYGAYDQNDFLMNFYVSPLTITNANYPLSATNHPPPSSYNPFHYHHEIHDVNSNNNDNWATFNSDNFADFDSHFSSQTEDAAEPCFVATTQTVEISTEPPAMREFQLGQTVTAVDFQKVLEELDDDEFYSLRDDSNSLTDDNEKKLLENTEVPDDEDDDFASADER
jgi:hypothetical protein